jgi:ubiquinone/menaquinone biosynthesis C-methylase UbiE
MQKEWFVNWFDSPYYHTLYKNRDDNEAENFINNLVAHLNINKNARVLDLACGKGRHSIMLHKHGLDVTGLDLSVNSIAHAQQFATNTLQFCVHDMRNMYCSNYFDVVFNLFTSYGYFKTNLDNEHAAKRMVQNCKQGGLIVVDFFNTTKVIRDVKAYQQETKIIDGISFVINKNIVANQIIKTIVITEPNGNTLHFTEEVQTLNLEEFTTLFNTAGASLVSTFGNYNLEPFDEQNSMRLVMVFRKN